MQVGLIGHHWTPSLQQVPAHEELAGHSRSGQFGVMLRALRARSRYAGRPTTSWAVRGSISRAQRGEEEL